MITFGIRTLIIILVTAGIIALVGDNLGHAIGRKRVTIFGLRPRHTALAFTIITGIIIAFLTIGTLLLISQDARTALFGLESLRAEVKQNADQLQITKTELTQKTAEKDKIVAELNSAQENLTKAEQQISQLKQIDVKLKKQIAAAKKDLVLFKVNDVLTSSLIQAGPEKDKLELGLKQILSATDLYIRSLGVESQEHLIVISPKNFSDTVAKLQNSSEENIIKVAVKNNTLFGEPVNVEFITMPNKLIYKKSQLITQDEILPGSNAEIEQQITNLLKEANYLAKSAGVQPDNNGQIGTIAYSYIYALSKDIKRLNKKVKIFVTAKNDIYAIGPLEVELKLDQK